MPDMNRYLNRTQISEKVSLKKHRQVVGGLWEEIGELQLNALKSVGLRTESTLLDAGCGSLRAGHLAIDYLRAGHYWGFDYNEPLITAGYANELNDEQRLKCPVENLFEHDITQPIPLNRTFDFALAFSIFTHLSFQATRIGLANLAAIIGDDGILVATFFIVDDKKPDIFQQSEAITTYSDKDPFHFSLEDINMMLNECGLKGQALTQFKHPRSQQIFRISKAA